MAADLLHGHADSESERPARLHGDLRGRLLHLVRGRVELGLGRRVALLDRLRVDVVKLAGLTRRDVRDGRLVREREPSAHKVLLWLLARGVDNLKHARLQLRGDGRVARRHAVFALRARDDDLLHRLAKVDRLVREAKVEREARGRRVGQAAREHRGARRACERAQHSGRHLGRERGSARVEHGSSFFLS